MIASPESLPEMQIPGSTLDLLNQNLLEVDPGMCFNKLSGDFSECQILITTFVCRRHLKFIDGSNAMSKNYQSASYIIQYYPNHICTIFNCFLHIIILSF